jgi:molybdopterin converting factor small subunit
MTIGKSGMQVHVTLYGAMRVIAGTSQIQLSFDAPAVPLARVVEALVTTYPRIRPYLLDTTETLHPSIRVLVNNERVIPDSQLTTPILADSRLVFLAPMAGGAN